MPPKINYTFSIPIFEKFQSVFPTLFFVKIYFTAVGMLSRMSSGLKDNFKGDSYEKIIGILAAALFLTACGQAPTTTTTQETTTATTVVQSTTVTLNITKDGQAIEGPVHSYFQRRRQSSRRDEGTTENR